jgi:hypothetical protein
VISLPLPLNLFKRRNVRRSDCIMHACTKFKWFYMLDLDYICYASNIAEIPKLPLSGRLREINELDRGRDFVSLRNPTLT